MNDLERIVGAEAPYRLQGLAKELEGGGAGA